MFRITAHAVPRLILPVVLFFGVQAFAQFEVAPDHFDSTDQKTATKNTAKPVQTAISSSSSQVSHAVTQSAASQARKRTAQRTVSASRTPARGRGQHNVAASPIAAAHRKRTGANNASTVSP